MSSKIDLSVYKLKIICYNNSQIHKTDGKPVIPLLTYTFATYIQDNYITLLLLMLYK
jgi:hypothetical protein